MINWYSLVFILPGILVYAWPGNSQSSVNNDLFIPSLHNHSALNMKLWEENNCQPTFCCWRWLLELQSTQCPFMRLLVHCLIALPVYNLLLFLIGWQLHRSCSYTAERLLWLPKPIAEERLLMPQPSTVVVKPLLMPPTPPPRCKRRQAPKPPTGRIRATLSSPDKYPSHKDPFATVPIYDPQQEERYKTLRLNLLRVLEGLQQPLPPMLSLPLPMPVVLTSPKPTPELHKVEDSMLEESTLSESMAPLDLSKSKRKPSKWLHTVVKRLGKTFSKSKSRKHLEVSTAATLSHRSSSNSNITSSSRSDRSINTLQPFWQRIARSSTRRGTGKSKFYVNSPSSSETNSSASCIYAY
ncbi:uncharacterized protein LOC133844280 isoform X2 [Drosophila sulfurigaster albostrigata]|uniref:uncharacterized protein LOC133844280 isoform X2 n=1 Tax=Drosophila sulfurigaster albostrigata TaxID=89887 RepID=UPI002D21C379|nr:uncharacterized protein LOC133844280 isoform X2 [Drosophila sulfurigaster albostrigata]